MVSPQSQPANSTARHSCLYECRVRHERLEPRRHRFDYGIFLFRLDLDELATLDRELRWFSRNRPNWYQFRDSDHLPHPAGPERPLKAAIIDWLGAQGVQLREGSRIELVTLPRIAGYVFNPVSFFFVQDPDGLPVCAVAEVGNTFGELKPFLVPLESAPGKVRFRRVVPKEFYVSPFSDLEICFDFRLHLPGDRLEVVVNDVTPDGRTLLLSSLVGNRRPLTDRQLVWMTFRYPLQTLRVITLIHWQALRLWLKRIPWHPKAAHPHLQRGVHRPHAALAVRPSSPATPPLPAPLPPN